MSEYLYLLAGAVFLPLFPLNMAFHELFVRISNAHLRAALLLVWPLPGIAAVQHLSVSPLPAWLIGWALASAVLSAYRALALRDVAVWIAFLASSAWPILWPIVSTISGRAEPFGTGIAGVTMPYVLALAFSAPLVLLALLTGRIERQFGAAHTALKLQLADRAPRLAALFVAAILASVATPVSPNFFVLIKAVSNSAATVPAAAAAMLLVWLLWSWSGALILQAIVVGGPAPSKARDLNRGETWIYVLGFVVLAVAGVTLGGRLI